MIENKLTFIELNRILRPILKLEDLATIISEYREVFSINLRSLEDIQNYTQKYNVTYQDFRIFIKGLGEIEKDSTYISIDFRLDKKWYHTFKNPTTKIVNDLKIICSTEMNGLSFKKYSTVAFDKKLSYKPAERKEYIFEYDGRALNVDWTEGSEISTLLISPSENDKYLFVEFHYNSTCYYRLNGSIYLRDDWKIRISDVNNYLKMEVDKFFNSGQEL